MQRDAAHYGVIVAVDGSAASRVAADWAARDAVLRDATLTAVYVSADPDATTRWAELRSALPTIVGSSAMRGPRDSARGGRSVSSLILEVATAAVVLSLGVPYGALAARIPVIMARKF
jgi:nucleotide-binding universal stress UspA family protein